MTQLVFFLLLALSSVFSQVCTVPNTGCNSNEVCSLITGTATCVRAGNQVSGIRVCLSDSDCDPVNARCAPNPSYSNTPTCFPCTLNDPSSNIQCGAIDWGNTNWACNLMGFDAVTSFSNTGGHCNGGNPCTYGHCIPVGAKIHFDNSMLANSDAYSYQVCRSSDDCSWALYPHCFDPNTYGDFRGTGDLHNINGNTWTPVCGGCESNADCYVEDVQAVNSRRGVCDLTGILHLPAPGSGAIGSATLQPIHAIGTCKDAGLVSDSGDILCYDDHDCNPGNPLCRPTAFTGGIYTINVPICQPCTADSHCALYPGTVCYVEAVTGVAAAGECAPPTCSTNNDCASHLTPVCDLPGTYTSSCVGCAVRDDCSDYPSTPYCNTTTTECEVGCYTDGHCFDGFHCLNHQCVQCFESTHCYSVNEDTPICNNDTNTCEMCTEDSQCLAGLPIWEGCHTEFDNDVQTIGRCVADTYNKGFQIAALILGSIGVFLVIVALVLAAVALMKD